MDNRDLDAEFERIVAGWDEEAPDPTPAARSTPPAPAPNRPGPPSPVTLPKATPPNAGPPVPAAPEPTAPPEDPGLTIPIAPITAHVWRGQEPVADVEATDGLPDSDDDHFEPPEVELPTTEEDPMFWLIAVGLTAGPLLLIYFTVFDRGGSTWWIIFSIAMIIGAFVMLVIRGGTERDPFDDGSRV